MLQNRTIKCGENWAKKSKLLSFLELRMRPSGGRSQNQIHQHCNWPTLKHTQVHKGRRQKREYFTVRLTVRVRCFVISSEGFIWLLFVIVDWLKQILTKKKVFGPFVWPFGWVKMSIASSNKHDNGTKKAMMRSALNMHF